MIKFFSASSDTTITNRYVGNSLTKDGQHANFGHGAFLETFWWVDRLTGSGGSSIEEARILLEIPYDSDIDQGRSWNRHLVMHPVATSEGAPSNFTATVQYVTGSFDAGRGIDDLYTQHNAGTSWLSASATVGWDTAGGDRLSAAINVPFTKGTEKLDVNIGALINGWEGTGRTSPIRLMVSMLTGSAATTNRTKAFWSCEGPYEDLKPKIINHIHDRVSNSQRLLVLSQSNAIFCLAFTNVYGHVVDHPDYPIDTITAKFEHVVDSVIVETILDTSPGLGVQRLYTGTYRAIVTPTTGYGFSTTGSSRIVWYMNTSGALIHSGSLFTPRSYSVKSYPSKPQPLHKQISLGEQFGQEYDKDDVVQFELSMFETTFPQTFYTTATTALTNKIPHGAMNWRLRNLNRDQLLFDFFDERDINNANPPGAGDDAGTAVAYGVDRNYIELSMAGLERGASYAMEFGVWEPGTTAKLKTIKPLGAVFKISKEGTD